MRDELAHANTELERAYEELQSLNEELETMNEELQSTNDELQAINEELRGRTEELDQVNGFLGSVLRSLGSAVIVLNAGLRVRVWSPGAVDLWGLRSEEAQSRELLARHRSAGRGCRAHAPAGSGRPVGRREPNRPGHEDIAAADIAAAACVTTRSVQLAFRRRLDSTPMEYLCRVRLDHAHRQLVDADPEHKSVTAVAYRWGFSSPSRFAAAYRKAYGVLPSRSLRG